MNILVFLATAWGPVGGGINCMNTELASACAVLKKESTDTKICCIVPDLSEQDICQMEKTGIIPITLSKTGFEAAEACDLIYSRMRECVKLSAYFPNQCCCYYIGHDIYTGQISRSLSQKYGGYNIVFHHMDYESYYSAKNLDMRQYGKKKDLQRKILMDANLVCAVGPKLLVSAIGKTHKKVVTIEVFPGLANFNMEEPNPNFTAIVFGRVEYDNVKVKQIKLAIDAFANAIKQDKETVVIGSDPKLNVIGYDMENAAEGLTEEVKMLQSEAEQIAGRWCNIVAQPYLTDRKKLEDELCYQSVAMMLSLHEGFGLVGYEAIAAGVPLILSKNSGLYQFLEREKLKHLVYAVEIQGSTSCRGYTDDDLKIVTKALRDIRQNETTYKQNATDLRQALLSNPSRYSWSGVANSFLTRVIENLPSRHWDSSGQNILNLDEPSEEDLPEDHRLLLKILSFRGTTPYAKTLLGKLCRRVNQRCCKQHIGPIFRNIKEIEKEICDKGYIEEISAYSYRNSASFLSRVNAWKINEKLLAFGLMELGRYYLNQYRNIPGDKNRREKGYFSCQCFFTAAGLSEEIKKIAKADYEAILKLMRIAEMDLAYFEDYSQVLRKFINIYSEPESKWIWYMLLHCEVICNPQVSTLAKVNLLLDQISSESDQTGLRIQMLRLRSELECELDMPVALQNFKARTDQLLLDNEIGVATSQFLASFISFSIMEKKYQWAEYYLQEYKKRITEVDFYPRIIETALKAELCFTRCNEEDKRELDKLSEKLRQVNALAKNTLKNLRASSWTRGLLGESQILLAGETEVKHGNDNIIHSMLERQRYGEKTKSYRYWLKRISDLNILSRTEDILEQERRRVNI